MSKSKDADILQINLENQHNPDKFRLEHENIMLTSMVNDSNGLIKKLRIRLIEVESENIKLKSKIQEILNESKYHG